MGLLQTFARQTGGGREKPGPTRGDVVLTEDALPSEIAGWTRTKFIPAPPVDELPDGQYWWVHQWQYQKDGVTALVSFDQLGKDRWHELSHCYRNLGYTILQRDVFESSTASYLYVVATMKDASDTRAILAFSEFIDDGTPISPPFVWLKKLNSQQPVQGIWGRAVGRTEPYPYDNSTPENAQHRRVLQCQVLLTNLNDIDESKIKSAATLHTTTRDYFAKAWESHFRRQM